MGQHTDRKHGRPSCHTPATDSFGALLRQCRLDRGLTQHALAERSHLHATTVSRLEAGIRPRLTHVARLAAALDVPVETFAVSALRGAQ